MQNRKLLCDGNLYKEAYAMDERMKEIISYVDAHRDEMIALWKDLVNLEGSSKEKANLDLVAARIKEAMEEAGATVTMVEYVN